MCVTDIHPATVSKAIIKPPYVDGEYQPSMVTLRMIYYYHNYILYIVNNVSQRIYCNWNGCVWKWRYLKNSHSKRDFFGSNPWSSIGFGYPKFRQTLSWAMEKHLRPHLIYLILLAWKPVFPRPWLIIIPSNRWV